MPLLDPILDPALRGTATSASAPVTPAQGRQTPARGTARALARALSQGAGWRRFMAHDEAGGAGLDRLMQAARDGN